MASTLSPTALSLEDLIALNQEIAALARVGAPLEAGLRAFASETPGRLGEIAAQINRRLGRGESLADSTAELPGVPPVYLAVVEAGVRAGRLPAALEGLAEAAQRVAQLRRATGLALAYPLIVLLTTYFLLLFLMAKIVPLIALSLEDAAVSIGPFSQYFTRAADLLTPWWFVPPLVLVIVVMIWWRQTSRSLLLQPGVGFRWLGWLPWFGKLQRHLQMAAFTKTLALLVENRQPLPESIVLAAQVTGSQRLAHAAEEARRAIASGAAPAAELRRCGLPPLVCWLLGGWSTQPDLASTLHYIANDYQQRAANQADQIRLLLPLIFTVGIAGTAVAVYALVLFLPWTTALRGLAAP